MDKTIKQLAEEIGVSKTAINKKVDQAFKKKYFKKNGNKFVINQTGQKIIQSMFKDKKRKLDIDINEKFENRKEYEVVDLVSILKERLKISDEQNLKKDEQIEKLQKLLDQQQVLTLQANKKIEALELKVEASDNQEPPLKESIQDEKKSFWARWFR